MKSSTVADKFLAKLGSESGDVALITRVPTAADKWNNECDEFFRV